MKRIFAAALAAILTVCLFSACRKSEITALYFAVRDAAGSFDPQIAADDAARTVARNCFEGLVTPGADGALLPGAAERWETDAAGLVYTFYLREGQKWHLTATAAEELAEKLPAAFAPEVTAEDFVFAFRRAADPATGAPDAALTENIAGAAEIAAGSAAPETLGVQALSKYVLQITLSQPQPRFLSLLAEPLFLPCNETFFNACGGRYGLLIKYMLSNGPFYLTRFDDTAYRMEKNPDYTGKNAPNADVIWLYAQSGDPAYFESLRTGDLAGGLLTPQQTAEFKPGKKSTRIPLNDILYGFLWNLSENADAGALPMAARQAFAAAVDVSALCEEFGKTPTQAYFPAAVQATGPAPADLCSAEEARTLLEEALRAAKTDSFTVTLLCGVRFETGLRRQLQEWQKILGAELNIRIEALPETELSDRIARGDFELALCPVAAPSADACDWFAELRRLTGLTDPAYEAAEQALSVASAPADAADAQTLLAETAGYLPLWADGQTYLCTEGVSGVIALPGADRIYFYAADKEQ